jgi:hypothetical protein
VCVSDLYAALLPDDRGANAAGVLEEEALPELPTSDHLRAHVLKSALSYGVSIMCLWCIYRVYMVYVSCFYGVSTVSIGGELCFQSCQRVTTAGPYASEKYSPQSLHTL